jgi:DNA-binding MarR family transcriptional regulator
METQCYCSALRAAARRLSAVYDAALAPVGVNVGQFRLLRVLSRIEPATLTELGRETELDRSTVGRNAKVLERMGLLTLGRGAADQREAPAMLTDAGRRVLADGAPLWADAQQGIERRIGAKAADDLRSALAAL